MAAAAQPQAAALAARQRQRKKRRRKRRRVRRTWAFHSSTSGSQSCADANTGAPRAPAMHMQRCWSCSLGMRGGLQPRTVMRWFPVSHAVQLRTSGASARAICVQQQVCRRQIVQAVGQRCPSAQQASLLQLQGRSCYCVGAFGPARAPWSVLCLMAGHGDVAKCELAALCLEAHMAQHMRGSVCSPL